MAPLGHGNCVGVVLHVGGSKVSGIKYIVLHREPRIGKTLFLAR
jgi:chemotaxis receptor (MCP) glutamine deamidase CheD